MNLENIVGYNPANTKKSAVWKHFALMLLFNNNIEAPFLISQKQQMFVKVFLDILGIYYISSIWNFVLFGCK